MPIDVYVQPKTEAPKRGGDYEYVCGFPENEGEYWFLHPLFEKLLQETGQYIDLYGDAVFGGDALGSLGQTLLAARELVAAQPDRWEVFIGVQTHPVHKEISVTVDQAQMELLVANLQEAVGKAKEVGASVRFLGD